MEEGWVGVSSRRRDTSCAVVTGVQTCALPILSRELSRTLTVQIVHSDPAVREREARAAAAALGKMPGVASVKPFNREGIGAFLEPWLGAATFDPELPLPALIDVSFDGASSDGVGRVQIGRAHV